MAAPPPSTAQQLLKILSRLGSLVTSKQGKLVLAGLAATVVAAVVKRKREAAQRQRAIRESLSPEELRALELRKKTRVAVNKEFFLRLKYLIRIVLPSWKSKEALLLILHSSFLVVRTFLSLYVASLDGAIVKSIVEREGKQFLWELGKWIGIAIPATYINSMIRFLESKLALAFRSRLVEHVYRLYMSNETYYRIGNLDGRIANADQCMTEDVSRFCNHLAHLYSHLSKPFLDVLLMTGQLFRLGIKTAGLSSTFGPLGIAGIAVGFTGLILQLASPPFGKLVAEQASRDGHLRYVHSRLITHAEEIAFYGGDRIETGYLAKAYQSLVSQVNLIYRQRIPYVMIEQFLMKYVWSAAGMCMIAIPTIKSKQFLADQQRTAGGSETPVGAGSASSASSASVVEDTAGNRTEHFMTARSLLTTAADAIERIMSSYKEITELAGYTARVHEMVSVFQDVESGNFERKSLEAEHADPVLRGTGVVVESKDDEVKLENVPVVTPNGDVLIRSLSFEIHPGMHLLITGPNGCGKSSTFRMLGGLWPIYGGKLTRPKRNRMFYIPQRPYLSLGNFREQIIYPDTLEDMRAKGRTDAYLDDILNVVNLGYVVKREGGWEATSDWNDVLSGGEKQRVGMARLFYHRPAYALLDECTSAVSIDVEGQMYQHAKDLGITLLTVTHRPSLWKFHTHLLQFDGEGGYKFSPLDASARLSLKEEKNQLEGQLATIPKAQNRLRELCHLLGEDSVLLPSLSAHDEAESALDEKLELAGKDAEPSSSTGRGSKGSSGKKGAQNRSEPKPAFTQIVDVSAPISSDTPVWPGDPPVVLTQEQFIERGSVFNLSQISMSTHAGTHVDPPFHLFNDGHTVEAIELSHLVGPATVVEFDDPNADGMITANFLRGKAIPTPRVLFKTPNSAQRPSKSPAEKFAALSVDGAEYLVSRGVVLVGIDGLSIDAFEEEELPAHKMLLRHSVTIVEGLCMEHVQEGGWYVCALPLKLVGGDGAPARVVLMR